MLIGLHGPKQAGKDTVFERARRLMADVLTVERVSFADLLYESAAAAIDVDADLLRALKSDPACRVQVVTDEHDGERVRVSLTFREYLQRYGTEAHRDIFGQDFWVEQKVAELNTHKAGNRLVMVTDVRFENEARAVKAAGGTVIRVVGPPDVENSGDGHASEAGLPDELVDMTLTNSQRDDHFRALDKMVDTVLKILLRAEAQA